MSMCVGEIKTKLHLQKVSQFSVAQNNAPYSVAAYVPGVKGLPSNIRVSHQLEFTRLKFDILSFGFVQTCQQRVRVWSYKNVLWHHCYCVCAQPFYK